MASKAAAAAVKAITAEPMFIPKGPINAGRFNLIREIIIGTTLGLAGGFVWKTWHWGEKRRIATFYTELAQKELEEEQSRRQELLSKLTALEDELLS